MTRLPDLLTTAEAAAILGVNASRVRQLCLAGKLPGARKRGRDWAIPERAVQARLAHTGDRKETA